MSLITPKNKSRPASTRTDSLKARSTESRPLDDEVPTPLKLSALQVTNVDIRAADANESNSNTQKDPCDLNLTLTGEERFAKAEDYLREEILVKSGDNKAIHATPADVDDASSTTNIDSDAESESESESDKSVKPSKLKKGRPKQKVNKNKDDKSDDKATRMEKKIEYVYKILGEGYRIVDENDEVVGRNIQTAEKKSTKVPRGKSKAKDCKSKSTTSGSSQSTSESDGYSSPRKNIRWKRKPQIAVKMNRTAALRLEKGAIYCGYKPTSKSKVDEYFAKRAKRILARRAKAKAEIAEALRVKREAESGAGSGSGASREDDFLAGQKCEYMRCRRYTKK